MAPVNRPVDWQDNWPLQLHTDRVSLEAIDPATLEADWLDEAAQAIAGRAAPCRIENRLSHADQGWWIIAQNERVGALCGRLVGEGGPDDRCRFVWTWLAIAAKWRAYGYGGLIVPVVESTARQVGATEAVAPLPPDNGVALYFWLRLGYTPTRNLDIDPADLPIGIDRSALWMQRSLQTNST